MNAELSVAGAAVVVRPLADREEARACAAIMAGSDPWVTLGRDYEMSLAIITDPSREVYVARHDAAVAGFLILNMRGTLTGFIQTVAVHEAWRGRGLGSRLIALAEDRILRDAPNVFMCVSSFNVRAKALYERLGYEVIGELRDYIVRGHSEWLLRKTAGPLVEFAARR